MRFLWHFANIFICFPSTMTDKSSLCLTRILIARLTMKQRSRRSESRSNLNILQLAKWTCFQVTSRETLPLFDAKELSTIFSCNLIAVYKVYFFTFTDSFWILRRKAPRNLIKLKVKYLLRHSFSPPNHISLKYIQRKTEETKLFYIKKSFKVLSFHHFSSSTICSVRRHQIINYYEIRDTFIIRPIFSTWQLN